MEMLQKVSKALLLSVMSVCLIVTFRSVVWADSLLCESDTCADKGCAAEGGRCVVDASDGGCYCGA